MMRPIPTGGLLFFVDLDGVLADWTGAVERSFTLTPGTLKHRGQVFAVHKALGRTFDEFDTIIKRESAAGWWRQIEPLPWAAELVKLFDFKRNAFILTSPWQNDSHCYEQKVRWCYDHFKIHSDHVIPFYHKHLLAGRNRWLIDDKLENCADWRAAGGGAILFPCYHNEHSDEDVADPLSFLKRNLKARDLIK